MRTSSKKTTPAVLRSILGITDVEMAELLGCSPSTIHSVESGRLKLSESLALRMSLVTGVDLMWLLDGDTSKPPTCQYQRRPYSRSEFEDWQLSKTKWLRVGKTQRAINIVRYFAQLRAILESANKRGGGDYIMTQHKVGVAIEALRTEQFGQDSLRFAALPLKTSIKIAEGAIADVRAFIRACERNAKRNRQSPKRQRSKRPLGRRKSKA